MEFTRDLLTRFERNAESARSMTRDQALRELDRINNVGRIRAATDAQRAPSQSTPGQMRRPQTR